MRFKEFNQHKKTDEAGAINAIGGALAKGAKSVGGMVAKGAKTIGGAIANTAQGAVQGAIQGATQTTAQPQQQAQTQQQIQLKPGMNITSPTLGQTKVKSLQGPNAVLDTQKTLGLDVTVNKDELLATLGQNQQGAPGSKSPAAKNPGLASKFAQGFKFGSGVVGALGK